MLEMRRLKETDDPNCYIQHAERLTMLHLRYRVPLSADTVCVLYSVLNTTLCREMVWSGVEWSGVEWSGVERSVVYCVGVFIMRMHGCVV